MEVKTRSVDHTQNSKDIGGQVQEQNGLEPIRAWSLLGLEVRHRLPYGVLVDDVQEMSHNVISRGGGVVVTRKVKWGRLGEVSPEEEVGGLIIRPSGCAIRLKSVDRL